MLLFSLATTLSKRHEAFVLMNIKSMVSKIGSIQYILHMPSSRNDRYWRHPSFKREKLIGFDETGATRLSSYVYGICLIHTLRCCHINMCGFANWAGPRCREVTYMRVRSKRDLNRRGWVDSTFLNVMV